MKLGMLADVVLLELRFIRIWCRKIVCAERTPSDLGR